MAIPSSSKINVFNFIPISPSQVHKALLSLDCKKSAGPDQIEPYFLKISAMRPIASIFNLSLNSGIIPSSWKSAIIRPNCSFEQFQFCFGLEHSQRCSYGCVFASGDSIRELCN